MEGRDQRAARLARNEASYREVNEQIAGLDSLGPETASFGIVCECGSVDCVSMLTVTRAEYESARSESDQFLIEPGHETEEIERVVERHRGYDVVDKKAGVPQRVTEETDPRGSAR